MNAKPVLALKQFVLVGLSLVLGVLVAPRLSTEHSVSPPPDERPQDSIASSPPPGAPDSALLTAVAPPEWGRSYVPLAGGSPTTERFPVTSTAGAAIPRPAPSVDTRPFTPVIVQRLSASRLRYFSPGPGSGSNPADDSGPWVALGTCDASLVLVPEPATPNGGRGREIGPVGNWVFTLAVPARACTRAAARAAIPVPPPRSLREGLAASTQRGSVVEQLGSPPFAASDLVDIAVFDGAAETLVFGVFRKPLRTTQISPPPPQPQLAFIAQRAADGAWRILWARYAASSTEFLAMVGAFDEAGGGSPDAYFAVREPDGGGRLLRIAPGANGAWALQRTSPF